MDNKGYYKILEVDEKADEKTLRSQYRKLCLKWHPDRWVNGTDEEKKIAEDNFKKLNEAYSVLSDKDKRQAYDMGIDGNSQQGYGFNPFDIFREHFGNMNGFDGFDFNFGGFKNQTRQQVRRGSDINVTLDITMEEANNGANKTVSYEVHEKCEHCNGTGFGEGGGFETCPHCNGSGMLKETHRQGFMTVVTQTPCPHCGGSGKMIKNPCPHCNGTGFGKMKNETINITIPVGVGPGQVVCVQGFGDYPQGNNGVRGDLNIQINIVMPEGYSFSDNFGGVEYEMEIPFYDAILGCERDVVFPSGKTKKIKIDKNTRSGEVYSYKNEGMKLKNGIARSSFDVIVNYETPKRLTKEQEELLKEFKNIEDKKKI